MSEQVLTKDNLLFWNIKPKQVGYRFPENIFDEYEHVSGVYIQPGTKALIIDGENTEVLSQGTYHFGGSVKKGKKQASGANKKESLLQRLFSGGQKSTNGAKPKATKSNEKKKVVKGVTPTVAQVREGAFPLYLTISSIPGDKDSTSVKLRAVVNVSDIQAFYTQFLVDQTILTTEELAELLKERADKVLKDIAAITSYDELRSTDGKGEAENRLLEEWKNLESWGLQIDSVQMLVVENEREDRFKEEERNLQDKERELEQAIARNEYLNRLADVENRHSIDQKASEQELEKELWSLEKNSLLSQQEKENFRRAVDFDKKLKSAKDVEELERHLRDVEKSKLLSKSDLDSYRRSIEKDESQEIQLFEIMKLKNQQEIDELQTEWRRQNEVNELEHKKQLELRETRLDADRKRIENEYALEQKRKEQEFLREKQKQQMESLKEAQKLRKEREDAEHQRELDKRRLESEKEQARLDTFNTMTPEQIMVSNPDINPEAAKALAEMSKGKSREDQMEKIQSILEKKNEDMQDFMEKQMDISRDLIGGQVHREELQRYIEFLRGTTPTPGPGDAYQKASYEDHSYAFNCPSCGGELPQEAKFCPHCGAKASNN